MWFSGVFFGEFCGFGDTLYRGLLVFGCNSFRMMMAQFFFFLAVYREDDGAG
jgi:hypothetical protein